MISVAAVVVHAAANPRLSLSFYLSCLRYYVLLSSLSLNSKPVIRAAINDDLWSVGLFFALNTTIQ